MAPLFQFATTMLIISSANGDGAEHWRKWHSRRLRDSPHPELQRSLGLHMDIRHMVENSVADEISRENARKVVEKHREAVEKVRDLHLQGFNISEFVNTMRYTEQYAVDYYHKLMGLGAIPAPEHPSEDQLATALRDSTGINPKDLSDDKGELFRIMTRHWNHEPPPTALGVSAKFHKDGRIERERYHVALHLPCDDEWDRQKLGRSAKAAAAALKAPPLVYKWIEEVAAKEHVTIQSMGFGLAVLSDGSRAGKIYVVNPTGMPMPHLPLGGGKVLKDSLPGVGISLDQHMVSLEWVHGDEKVALRHYAYERGVSHEQRIQDWAGHTPAKDNLVHVLRVAKSGTENVKVTPFFTEKEVEQKRSAPAIIKVKFGLRLEDEYLSDNRFNLLSLPLLKTLGINEYRVQKWVKDSSKITHSVSNWQAGDSHITFYRHPLRECTVTQHVAEIRRRLNASANPSANSSATCGAAQEAFASSMWSGACKTSMAKDSNCTTCMSGKSGDFNGACYNECKSTWEKSCSSSCTTLINDVITKCKNCHKSPSWCGKKGEVIGSTTLPTTWPTAACSSCNSAQTSCTDDKNVCPAWIKTNYAAAAFDKTFTDGDMISMIDAGLAGTPDNCKYPIYPWYGTSFPMCNTCDSMYGAQYQMFLWGGGPCAYISPCQLDSVTGDKEVCAKTTKAYKCGCHCGEIFDLLNQKCTKGATTCSDSIPSRCVTSDSDVYNKCDYGKYSDVTAGSLWSERMDMTQCYKKDKTWATQCATDVAFTAPQIMFWLKEMEKLTNYATIPSNAFATSLQLGAMKDVTFGSITASGGGNSALVSGAVRYASCVLFLTLLSAYILI